MKTLRSFETSGNINPETQRYIAEELVFVNTVGNRNLAQFLDSYCTVGAAQFLDSYCTVGAAQFLDSYCTVGAAQFLDSYCTVGAQPLRRMSGDTVMAIGWRLRYNSSFCLFVCLFACLLVCLYSRKGAVLLSGREVPLCRIALH